MVTRQWLCFAALVVCLVLEQSLALSSLSKGQHHTPHLRRQRQRALQSVIDPLIPAAPGVVGEPKVNTKRQEKEDDDEPPGGGGPDSVCPVDDTSSVFMCSDPNREWALPCDATSCVWDTGGLNPDAPPEGCQFITVKDPNEANLPDEFKPCALWDLIFGEASSGSPSPSPLTQSPTAVPTASATTEAPVAATTSIPTLAPAATTFAPSTVESQFPTVVAKVPAPVAAPKKAPVPTTTTTKSPYYISFDTILLNLIIASPLQEATRAFDRPTLHTELRSLTEQHALQHVRSQLKDTTGALVTSVSANVSSVSLLAPWSNRTVVATHAVSGTVVFSPDNGPPRATAVNNMVHGAFRSNALLQYLQELDAANDTMLTRVYAVHMGLPSDILPTTVSADTENSNESSRSQEQSTKSKMKDALWGWTDNVEWGDWKDTNFIIFIATTGSALLLLLCCGTMCACRCRLRRRKMGKNSFTELPDKTSKSTDTEQLSPAPVSNSGLTPRVGNSDGTSVPLLQESAGTTNGVVAADGEDDTGPATEHRSNTRESMDAIIEAAFDQSTHRSVDAVMMSRMKGVIEDDLESSLSGGGRSETTSVYSYIDNKSIISDDEPNYSFGVAVTTNPTNMDDDQSANWSVHGGGGAGKPPMHRSQHVETTPQRSVDQTGISKVSATASTPEASNLMIFCNDKSDDSVSLINDSIILSALDNNFTDEFQVRLSPPVEASCSQSTSSAGAAGAGAATAGMTTNSRVAAVVANLEAKMDGSPDSHYSSGLVNYGMPKSPNSSGFVSDTKDILRSESTESKPSSAESIGSKPDRRSPSGSDSSQRGGGAHEEEDRSSVGSVSLASYAAPAYKKDRSSAKLGSERGIEVGNTSKPPMHRAQSTGPGEHRLAGFDGTTTAKVPLNRGRSASPAKYMNRETGEPSWTSPKPAAAAASTTRDDIFLQQQRESTAKALAFWNKSSGKSSRASQMVLDQARAPSDSPQSEPSPTETYLNLHRSPATKAVDESYQESESDIQSICSYDDRSLFSFAKSKHERVAGSTPYNDKQPSLLGAQRLPATSMDGSEEYNLPTPYQE